MPSSTYNLAIETSARRGSIALGRSDTLLEVVELPEPRRHRVELMPAIAHVCRRHGATPDELGEVYISLGPGSFTGLRIGIATVKMMALALDVRVVGVPTLDVLAWNVPGASGSSGGCGGAMRHHGTVGPEDRGVADSAPATPQARPQVSSEARQTVPPTPPRHLAVCLNLKKDTVWSAAYTWEDGRWRTSLPPALRTLPELLALLPRPLALLGAPLPPLDPVPEGVTVLPTDLAAPRAQAVWHLGRMAARQEAWTEPARLLPLYARPPEAVELWKQRKSR